MNLLTILLSIVYRRNVWLLFIWFTTVHAADLTFTPATPVVKVNKTITLSVSGTTETVMWSADKGKISDEGNKVTYLAPDQVGFDMVKVTDSQGNTASVKVIITSSKDFSPVNAKWEIFTDRNTINALSLSEDGKTLWVGTNGGLEKYDVQTEEIQQLFLNTDGLPDNQIRALSSDSDDGLWIGTAKGLVYLNSEGKFNSTLPPGTLLNTSVTILFQDKQGEWWVGTEGGLAHRNGEGKWENYNILNSELPANSITAITDDGSGGLWIGCYDTVCQDDLCDYPERMGGLVHLTSQKTWVVYTEELPSIHIEHLLKDQGGLWIDTDKGLAYLNHEGKWIIYPLNVEKPSDYQNLLSQEKGGKPWVDNSGLIHLNEQVITRDDIGILNDKLDLLANDGNGGVWFFTQMDQKAEVVHLNKQGKMTVYPKRGKPLRANKSDILSDQRGGLWIITIEGIVHLNNRGEEKLFNKENSKLPDNNIASFSSDGQGGLWVLTQKGSLTHLNSQGELLPIPPNNKVLEGIMCDDGQGGVWIGKYGKDYSDEYSETYIMQLEHLGQDRWVSYEKNREEIDEYHEAPLLKSLFSDGQGGVWMVVKNDYSTGALPVYKDSLIHFASEKWMVYDQWDELEFHLTFLDKKGDLWIGMSYHDEVEKKYLGKGLAHLNAQDGLIKISTIENSKLPANYVSKLLDDGQGGLWIITKDDFGTDDVKNWSGAGKGLAHLNSSGEWTVYNKASATLLSNEVTSIINDNEGDELSGLWIGTDAGLVHYGLEELYKLGEPQIFNEDNSDLLSNQIEALLNDSRGGLWIKTNDGLVHLSFGRQIELCTQTQIDDANCQAILKGQHAAIIVAAGGAQKTNSLWESTETITTNFYRIFFERAFDKSNLYYLSSKTWVDFDGNGRDDHINRLTEERDLTYDDLVAAFDWAKELGKLDQPLYFFFMDHGGKEKLRLSPSVDLTAEKLDTLLDGYQQDTGNEVIAIIEACYSGSFLPILKAPRRAIISSSKADEVSYPIEKQGFSSFLAESLLKGSNFFEAFQRATREQERLLGKKHRQTPQLDDNGDGLFDDNVDGDWLKKIYVNGRFVLPDATLTINNQQSDTTLSRGQDFALQVQVTQDTTKRVWALIRPPAISPVLDVNGTPISAFTRQNLVTTPENSEIWQTSWKGGIYNGEYLITFYAEDGEEKIIHSERDMVLTINNGVDPPPQAAIQINLAKDSYSPGEHLTASFTLKLAWGYDLYVAVELPNGSILTFKGNTSFHMGKIKPWYAPKPVEQKVTFIDWTSPLPPGQYCFYGILSPEKNDVMQEETQKLWVMDYKCFEITND
jgi:ligand-binding sensor domain-containing protein